MSTSAPKNHATKDKIVRTVVLSVGILVSLGMAYGAGMRAQVGKVRAANAAQKQAEYLRGEAQNEARASNASVQLLDARRALHLSLLELDARNFGTAQNHVQTAAALLKASNAADFAGLAARIGATNLVAAADIAVQRDMVLGFAREFDRLRPLANASRSQNGVGSAASGPPPDPGTNLDPSVGAPDLTTTRPQPPSSSQLP